jgi:hypothetical protein
MDKIANTEAKIQAAMTEYSALRTEIIQLEQIQWNIFALQLTATAVIFSFSLSNSSRSGFLLILPLISYALSRHHLGRSAGVDRLSRYIAEELSPKVGGGFGWEEWNRERTYSRQSHEGSRLYLILTDLLDPRAIIFAGVSIAALAWVAPYILFQPHLSILNRVMLSIAWFADLIFSLLTLYIFKRHVDEKRLTAVKSQSSHQGPPP